MVQLGVSACVILWLEISVLVNNYHQVQQRHSLCENYLCIEINHIERATKYEIVCLWASSNWLYIINLWQSDKWNKNQKNSVSSVGIWMCVSSFVRVNAMQKVSW